MTSFKQLSGFWLARSVGATKWQGDYYDHVLRDEEEVLRHVRYVAQNPVRRGLVDDWVDYPYTGSDTLDLKGALTRGQDPG
jgi:REP element-mobilizing transposase RayT